MEINNLKTSIIEDPDEILKYLQLGTEIPVWPEFYKYIINDFKFFNVKSFLITEFDNILGHTLIFNFDKNRLYFGFFGVQNDNIVGINYLINELKAYAKRQNFKILKGPINIPTIIFGWGFMDEFSKDTLFLGKPINNSIYPDLFLKNEFNIINKELTWDGEIPNISHTFIERYDWSQYEIFNPKSRNELLELRDIIIDLSSKNLPHESILTPNIENLIDNYLTFALDYGALFMFVFVRYKNTGRIIGCTLCITNPFLIDKRNKYLSICPFIVVIDKIHRNKGVGLMMAKFLYDSAKRNNVKYTSSPIESTNDIMIQIVENLFKFKKTRTHLIFELCFDSI